MDDIFETLYVSRGSGREGEGAPKEQGGGGGQQHGAWLRSRARRGVGDPTYLSPQL